MSRGRQMFEMMKLAAEYHARWEIETSNNIVRNRKKLLLLLILCLPILGFWGYTWAAGDILGGKTAFAPAFYTPGIFFATIFIGLAAGLVTGCIVLGGGILRRVRPVSLEEFGLTTHSGCWVSTAPLRRRS